MVSNILGFIAHPFAWAWTALIVGILIALPDNWTKRWTSRNQLGNWLMVSAGIVVLMFMGAIPFGEIRQMGTGVNILNYVMHPYTWALTLLVVGVIIALNDEQTDALLAQDKIGMYLIVVMVAIIVFGIGFLRLDRLVSGEVVLSFLLGALLATLWHYRAKFHFNRAESLSGTVPAPTHIDIDLEDEE